MSSADVIIVCEVIAFAFVMRFNAYNCVHCYLTPTRPAATQWLTQELLLLVSGSYPVLTDYLYDSLHKVALIDPTTSLLFNKQDQAMVNKKVPSSSFIVQ
jgi:hypothetical protein